MHSSQAYLSLFFILGVIATRDALEVLPFGDSSHCASPAALRTQPIPLSENSCLIDVDWTSFRVSSPFPKKCTNGRDMYLAVYRRPLCRDMTGFWREGDRSADFDGACVSSSNNTGAAVSRDSVALICRKGGGDDGPPDGTEFEHLWTRTSLINNGLPYSTFLPTLSSSSTTPPLAPTTTTSSAPLSATVASSSSPLPSESSRPSDPNLSSESGPGNSSGTTGLPVWPLGPYAAVFFMGLLVLLL
ncbi:uncharacterized protein PG998_000313 [Apiospora kogelbergensis]|uniref:uncharacterized protein n=1 Tax=Apiospora kogelbergensis TaxID=1337665 RepID=UPI003131CF5F